MRTGLAATLALVSVAFGCADYKQTHSATMTIWEVRVTDNPASVENCRLLGGVDSRDSTRGCGQTVQPTPEECLRYQVRYAGGDTLLINGPIGKAYDCSVPREGSAETPAPAQPPAAEPTITTTSMPGGEQAGQPTPIEVPTPTPTAAPAPAPTSPPAASDAGPVVRITVERGDAKGCVYLGDVSSDVSCADRSEACVDQAIRAGGDLVVVGAGRAQIFSCPPKP